MFQIDILKPKDKKKLLHDLQFFINLLKLSYL